jgi:nucleoside-diphosphate-sugar epimerase
MRVLVTGAQGCIGAWVVKRLLDRDLDVLAYDRATEPARLSMIASPQEISRVAFVAGDIADTARMKSLVREEGITHIVHLAAVLMPFCQAQPARGALVNVVGTVNVFEAARDAGRPVRVVYASSSAVWGPESAYERRPLRETDIPMPTTHYGTFKLCNEAGARVFYTADGISSVGLRPWTVYGPGRDSGLTADPTIAMKAVVLDTPFCIRLTGPMDLQYVADVAETFVLCTLSNLAGAHVFNLAGEVTSVDALIGLLEELRPGAADLIRAEGPRVPVAHRMDDSALRENIADIASTPLRQGVTATLEIFEKLLCEGRLDPRLD